MDKVDPIIEEIAQEEAFREKQSWFMLPKDNKQFYIDRAARIVNRWRELSQCTTATAMKNTTPAKARTKNRRNSG
jgi:hypothetical protein